MQIACTNINNNGIVIDKDLISKNVFKYNSILGQALFRLYDLGYQSSPSVFDLDDFRSALFSDFPKELRLLRDNLRGKISIDDELMVRYALLKSNNESFKEVLKIYLDMLTAKRSLDAYNLLISKIKIPKKSNIIKVKSRLSVSGSVSNYSIVPLDIPAIRESFLLEEDEELITYNTSEVMIKEIIKKLGYSEDVYLSHKESGQPFFISGVSQKDELSLLSIIISGKIIADGKFGKELVDNIQKYYNDFYSTHDSKIHCLNYEEVIFNNSLSERNYMIASKRAEFKDKPLRDFYVTTNEVIFAVKLDRDRIKGSYFKGGKLNLGNIALNYDSVTEFSKINTLSGLCGEFIHESTIARNGWFVKGLPVSIKFGTIVNNKLKLNDLRYYPLYNVYYSEDGSNVKPTIGDNVHITVSNLNSVLEKLGVSSKSELFNTLIRDVNVSIPSEDISRVKYEELITDLTIALIYAECGELTYELYGSDYSWVTDEIFYRASIEAEELFKSLGF